MNWSLVGMEPFGHCQNINLASIPTQAAHHRIATTNHNRNHKPTPQFTSLMEEFTEYSSEVVEFPSTLEKEKSKRFVHGSSWTDAIEKPVNKSAQTNELHSVQVQTDSEFSQLETTDERKLASWLKKIYNLVDSELSKGTTPLFDSSSGYSDNDISIKSYQKISDDAGCDHGAAAWLSVRTNNAPLLAVTTWPYHSKWCDHVGKHVKVFTPKRMQGQGFVIFTELTVLPVKSCIKTLCTNRFNKDIFAGGSFLGDIYIWAYKSESSSEEIKELFCYPTQHSCIVAMDWLTSQNIITCHSDGFIYLWKTGREIVKDKCFKIAPKEKTSPIVATAVLCISATEFVVGTEEGQLLLCSVANTNRRYQNFENPVVAELEHHSFAVCTLIKTKYCSTDVIVSCDLSGEMFFYDIRNSEDGPTLIVKMPLPFKNSIGCSEDANYIFSPGAEGSVEAFRVSNGRHIIVDGNLQGKGTEIKVSDNGAWIVTGVFKGNWQIFKIEN